MTTIETASLTRIFRHGALELPDPEPTRTPEEVRALLAVTYPDLLTAQIKGPVLESGRWVYTFKRSVGTKG